jgi:hypothetical protein
MIEHKPFFSLNYRSSDRKKGRALGIPKGKIIVDVAYMMCFASCGC